MPNPPFRRPILSQRDRARQQQRDPNRLVGDEFDPIGPGILGDEGHLNIPDYKDYPGGRPNEPISELDAGPMVARRNRSDIDVHLSPVYDGNQISKTDFSGQIRTNNASGGRVFHDVSASAIATIANQAVEVVFRNACAHIMVQNNSDTDITVDFDTPASLGSLVIASGAFWSGDIRCKSLWVYCTAVVNINGFIGGNVYIAGFN